MPTLCAATSSRPCAGAAVRKKERASIAATCRAGPGAIRLLELRAILSIAIRRIVQIAAVPATESHPGVVYGSTSMAAYGGRRSTESTPGPCWQKGWWWGGDDKRRSRGFFRDPTSVSASTLRKFCKILQSFITDYPPWGFAMVLEEVHPQWVACFKPQRPGRARLRRCRQKSLNRLGGKAV